MYSGTYAKRLRKTSRSLRVQTGARRAPASRPASTAAIARTESQMCATEEANGYGRRNGAHPEDLDTVALDGEVEDEESEKEESRAEVWVREVLLGIIICFAQVPESIAFAYMAHVRPPVAMHAAWVIGLVCGVLRSDIEVARLR